MAKILSIGEIMLEFANAGDGLYRQSFAGDTFNLAYYLRAVADGLAGGASAGVHQVDYLTALGMDESSEQCLRFMHKHGVGVSQCVRDEKYTIGLFILDNDARGEKIYSYWRGQSAARYLFDVQRDLSNYDWICFSGITAAILHNNQNLIASAFAAKQQGAQLVFDINYRTLLWSVGEARKFVISVLFMLDMVKISDDEMALLFPDEDIATLSKQYPAAEWVLTCQTGKSEAWRDGIMLARNVFQPNRTTEDTSAAGDAFLAAYLAAKLSGKTRADNLRIAHMIAKQVVQVKGSIAEIQIDLNNINPATSTSANE